ncbi:MAG: YdcF family protein [Pseudomonadota bacterium]
MTWGVRVAVLLLALLSGAFAVFHARQSQYEAMSRQALAAQTPIATTIVLTGARGRISQGLMLLASGRTQQVFISGVGEGVRLEDIPDIQSLPPDKMRCCVSLGYDALDTIGNAREIAAFLRQQNAREAFIVTSRYHMPRALAELRAAMPQLRPVAITVPGADGLRQQLREFGKYSAALIRLTLEP